MRVSLQKKRSTAGTLKFDASLMRTLVAITDNSYALRLWRSLCLFEVEAGGVKEASGCRDQVGPRIDVVSSSTVGVPRMSRPFPLDITLTLPA